MPDRGNSEQGGRSPLSNARTAPAFVRHAIAGVSVLVVGDDETDRSSLERQLAASGIASVVATDSGSALDLMGQAVEAVASGLVALGYPAGRVKTERFGATGQ